MAVASPKLHGRAQWRAPSSLSRRGHCSHIQANCRGVEQGLSPQPPGTFSNPYGTTYSSPKLFDSQTEYHTSPTPPSKRGGTTLRRRFRTGANGCGAPNAGAGKLIWSLREPSGGNADWRRYCAQWQYEYATDRADRGETMRTSKTINRILRSQEPGLSADEPVTSWRCQFCGRRFTDRTVLREHLEVEKQRQAGFAGDAWERGPDRSGGT